MNERHVENRQHGGEVAILCALTENIIKSHLFFDNPLLFTIIAEKMELDKPSATDVSG